MEFEWDESKRSANMAKHAIDFIDAVSIWAGPVIDPSEERDVEGEMRATALGFAKGDAILIAVVYTVRDGRHRIISARRARRNERADYARQLG